MDVTDTVMQSEIADGLLGEGTYAAPVVARLRGPEPFVTGDPTDEGDGPQQSVYADAGALIQEQIDEDNPNGVGMAAALRHGDHVVAARLEERGERQPTEAEWAATPPAERQQPARQATEHSTEPASEPLTPEAIRQEMEGLNAFVEANQLNQGESAATFPHELCGAIGTTLQASGVDPKGIVDFSSKLTSACLGEWDRCDGDISKLAPMPNEAAVNAGYQWAKNHGYDPQDQRLNLAGLGRMSRNGMIGILYAINAGLTEPEQINLPENIEQFRKDHQANTGRENPISYSKAKAYCNTVAKRALDIVHQLRQNQASQQQTARRSQSARRGASQRIPASMREGIKGSRPVRTGDDYFDEGVRLYQQVHGRL